MLEGFTSKEVVDAGFRKIRSRTGLRKTIEYFKQVDTLFDPNRTEIIEYRHSGVVTKENKKYIFHGLAGMETKQWRVAFIADVTDQFEN